MDRRGCEGNNQRFTPPASGLNIYQPWVKQVADYNGIVATPRKRLILSIFSADSVGPRGKKKKKKETRSGIRLESLCT